MVIGMEEILRLAGIPLLVFMVCLYYAIRLIVLQDISIIRNMTKTAVRDEKAYIKEAGKLLVIFAGATLLMAILLFFSIYIAFAEICISVIIMGLLWKRLNDKYGA